ncbi:unnamed protein product [Trypanosoma congolense IL3000]|uniref:Palmitoyltransferase n=1 Tax=Trypanosoma congolense (strain IL3000) TaxID=1068625 RepID=F9W6F2_TRYCI|nr:unnamed protein product [Trypanosoma congolense IL3000]
MTSSSPRACRTSIFQGADSRRAAPQRSGGSRLRWALTTAAVLAVPQIGSFTIVFFYTEGETSNLKPLAVMAFCSNALMAWNWVSSPGYVTSSEELQTAEVNNRWCSVCRLWQPLRSKHCNICERCVRKYDHHCFCIGGCVGESNHLRFFLLLTGCLPYVGSLLVALLRCLHVEDPTNLGRSFNRNIIPLAAAVFYLFSLIVLVCLWAMHLWLLLTNRTTWEMSSRNRITYLKSRTGNPFDKGVLSNICFLFQPKPINWCLLLKEDGEHLV